MSVLGCHLTDPLMIAHMRHIAILHPAFGGSYASVLRTLLTLFYGSSTLR